MRQGREGSQHGVYGKASHHRRQLDLCLAGDTGSRCGLCPVTHLREREMGISPFLGGSSKCISSLALQPCPCVFEHLPRARKMSLRHGRMYSLSSAFWHGEVKAQGIGRAPTASSPGWEGS